MKVDGLLLSHVGPQQLHPFFFFLNLILLIGFNFLEGLVINLIGRIILIIFVFLISVAYKVEVLFVIGITWVIKPWFLLFIAVKVASVDLAFNLRNKRWLHRF